MIILSVSTQMYYSIQHLQTAGYFVRRAERLERRLATKSHDVSLDSLIAGYAASALFTTVAFLEALVNEIFADAAQPNRGNLAAMDKKVLPLLAGIGESDFVQKSSVLTKFDILLRAAQKEPIPRGKNPYQDLDTAIRLRNELVHYKPEFFDDGDHHMARRRNFRESKLLQQIQGRFKPRPGGRSLASDGWISAGCASWAMKSAISFTDEVFLRLDVDPYYRHIRNDLPPSVVTFSRDAHSEMPENP